MPTSKTVTTFTQQTEQGTHVFDIIGYSQHRGGDGDGKPLVSGRFLVGGHKWMVLYFPDPANSINVIYQDRIMVLLVLRSENVKVRASYELRLFDQNTGSSVSVYKSDPRLYEFVNFDDRGSYIASFAGQRSLFESSTYLRDDRLRMECIVTVIKSQCRETRSVPKIQVPPSDITDHFAKLLDEKIGADVAFSVGGETFTAHKNVLAIRSPVFRAELYGPVSEGTALITIEDMQPDVFRTLLRFIYTDSLPPFDDLEPNDYCEMIRHMLVAADRYGMERLKLMCQSILCENLHVQTVATTLALADQHHCAMLKDACIEFISCSMNAVASTSGYKNLKRSCPSVLVDALEKTSKLPKVVLLQGVYAMSTWFVKVIL
ncbi:unnamed protein product [Urochloa decumbens]|uniref:Uncharacterized protein n=1 Tax=Urochloa decumbens TaxID=240449 RepID=A0ABC9BAW6_9POAL